ncbi:MAG TPA: ATP-binding protein [Acidobacteriota bacterium]|nr:ATP-binding protein [Acidobacteriota bacterium]
MKNLIPTSPLSLRFTLILYVILPLGLALTISGMIGLSLLEEWSERRMQEDIQLVARAISLPLSRALEEGEKDTLDDTLLSAFTIGHVYGAYVYNARGEKLAAVGHEERLPPSTHLSRVAQQGQRQGEYGDVAGRRVYSYFVPLSDSVGRINGLLQVTRRASDFREFIASVRRSAFIVLTGGLLIMAWLVLNGHNGAIGRHLKGIAATMNEVKRGDRLQRAPITGPGELASLADSLNTMLDSIQEAEQEIERQRQEQLKLNERLRQSEKLAAIGQLAAGVAHELGTPLSIIYGHVQRAERESQGRPSSFSRPLAEIRAQVERMERIISQLLDFGQSRQIKMRPVRADQIVASAVHSLSEEKLKQRVSMTGCNPAPLLRVDPFRIEQALSNLIRNAFQAGPEVEVYIRWFEQNGAAGYEIEDNGPGITNEARPRLFEPFYTTRSTGKGSGLGLAVVHGIVEEHGGEITVGTGDRSGALFRLTFPSNRIDS